MSSPNVQSPVSEPIPPGRIVILFKESPSDGATLGYYGTVARVHDRSIERNPSRPELWVYRVFLTHHGHYVDVYARDLIVTCDSDPNELPSENVVQVQFDVAPASDNEELNGVYRLSRSAKLHFNFRKSDQPAPTYQFSMPVERRGSRDSHLSYNVPRQDVLDRDYVLRVIAEFVGSKETAPLQK